MSALTVVVLALAVASVLIALQSIVGSVRYLDYARRASRPRPTPPLDDPPEVILIVPCCGAEHGLESNLDALLGQDYPRFHARFVVERADDGAVATIERVRRRHAERAELIVAGSSRDRGQKVHNLLAALDGGPLAEVLVFADSDGRPEPGWLRRLVAELGTPGVGVASSYRFYRPEPVGFTTLLRSVWNLSVLALLGDHDRNFAWGGSMAIRREVFERASVREAWRGAVSDDFALTHAVRRAGLRVAFVPGCLVGSEGRVELAALLSWAARQLSITRVYWPALFRLSAAGNLTATAFLVLVPFSGATWALAVLVAVLALGCASGGLRAAAVSRLAPQWQPEVRRWLWAYALLAPVSGLVTSFGLLRALASRRIEWRGTGYEMRSPHETRVLGR